MRELGGVFAVAVLVARFGGAGSYESPQSFAARFASVVAGVAALAALGANVATGLPRTASTTEPAASRA